MDTQPFSGPLFVVGSARSGTKLLRDLLNRNPRINLCDHETHFIPYLYQKHRASVSFEDPQALDQFFADYDRTPYQDFLKAKNRKHMQRSDFDALIGLESWSEVFGAIVRFHGKDDAPADAIWGDKTPSYLIEMPLLQQICPDARFVHIVRDPRDVVLSAQSAFGHSLYRVATKWARTVAKALRDGQALGDACLQVFYEDLVRDPERELRRICDFLGCAFDADMTTLMKPSENKGDAKGKSFIVATNVSKYKTKMTARQLRRVEEIVYPVARKLGYRLDAGAKHTPVNRAELAYATVVDGTKSVVRYSRKFGIARGLRITLGGRLQKLRKG